MSKVIKGFVVLILLVGIGVVLFFYNVYREVTLDANKIKNYHPSLSTEILDRNGNRLAYIFKGKHRLYATFDELPAFVIEALIAIEDTSFFEHKGVSPDAILRAIIADIKAGKFVEGGSTLTQQLVKNKMLSNKKKLERKIKEAILALKIENILSKEEIIERYLNEIPYGNNYYGIKTASQGYFHKDDLSKLTLKEATILIGIPNAPSYYNPRRHYERVLNRANAILFRMKSLGWISDLEYQKATKERPKIYNTSLTQNIAPYIVDEVVRRFGKKFPDIKTGGYKIYTTIDMKLQKRAKEALNYGYKKAIKKFKEGKKTSKLNGALVAVDNSSGDILALVGGVSYKQSEFNRATMAKRQPGSTFKPFIYQIALDMGYNPASPLTDLKRTFPYIYNGRKRFWSPKNYERNYKGFISLREALVHSRNIATVNLLCDIGGDDGCKRGVEIISQKLRQLDINKIPKDLSLALGNLSLSPIKMAQIYTVFSNEGHMIEPRLVSKILSRENAILYETQPKEIGNFTQPQQAYLMTSILKDVIKRGTGKSAKVKGIELAGKTGTTNDYIDAWFCGYSPEITTIIWFGRDNNRVIGKGATGGALAAPVFKRFYQDILTLYPNTKKSFVKPDGVSIAKYAHRMELFTKDSPLPEKEVYDILDGDYRPVLHEIGSLDSNKYESSSNFAVQEVENNSSVSHLSNSKQPKKSLEANTSKPYIRDNESNLTSKIVKINNNIEIGQDTEKSSQTTENRNIEVFISSQTSTSTETQDEFIERDENFGSNTLNGDVETIDYDEHNGFNNYPQTF